MHLNGSALMGKHKPTVLWALKPMGVYPQVCLKTANEREIDFSFFWSKGEFGFGYKLSRRDARLLARRINQILDDTR